MALNINTLNTNTLFKQYSNIVEHVFIHSNKSLAISNLKTIFFTVFLLKTFSPID